MEQKNFTIGELRRNISSNAFQEKYLNLISGNRQYLDDNTIQYLLKVAVVFLNFGDTSIQRLGYRIILRYSLIFDDYKPLFDVAINKGFIPVSKSIERQFFSSPRLESFFSSYFSSYQDNFLNENIYLSYGQKKLIKFSNDNKDNYVLVAPTSYGKSEIIIEKVCQNLEKKVCIVVPSKALLAQTKRRLLMSKNGDRIGRVVTHPEMYKGNETNMVAVLTQERLLRLLQKQQTLYFDMILVDEAHNLFKKDSRAILLAQVILILKKRNSATVLNFYSPFISDANNLKIPYANYELAGTNSNESLKVERYYNCDLTKDKKLNLYDQFLNSFSHYKQEEYSSAFELIRSKQSKKNIVYLNKPRDVVEFSLQLANDRHKAMDNQILDVTAQAIADFLHPDYNLLTCLKSGIAYHHGGMPEIVRLYVESIFTNNTSLNFIVTTSTLLEGVNIPAEKIFLLTTSIGWSIFTRSEFKNLIGRICRFSEVFDKDYGNLSMLEPEIFLVKTGEYEKSNANHLTFLQDKARVDIKLGDNVENVLLKDKENLKGKEVVDAQKAIEYLENIEPNTVLHEETEYVQSEIAQLCFRNNVYDFDIKENEEQLNANLDDLLLDDKIDDVNDLLEVINQIFFENITLTDRKIERLKNLAARKFYAMVLDWRTTSTSFKEMIGRLTGYWNSLTDPVIYFGSSWGEVKRNDEEFVPNYIDLTRKDSSARVNLAILKIKEEQDFVEFNLLKYIEILFDLGLVDSIFYERIKYGSSDPRIISLLKNGFSIELSKLLLDTKYADLITFNLLSDEIVINEFIVDAMRANQENEVLIFEVKYHIRLS